MKTLFYAVFLVVGFAASMTKAAPRTIEISSSAFNLPTGELRSLNLSESMYVRKLLIQAESANRENTLFDVIVNGDTKGTIHTPAADPTYVVTVEQMTASIQFRSLSGGIARIVRVMAIVEVRDIEPPLPAPRPARGQMAEYANQAIALTRKIAEMTTPREQGRYLVPIKQAAGRLYATAAARGNSSEQTIIAARNLVAAIDEAGLFLDVLMQRNWSFDCIVDLMTVREALNDAIE